MSANDSRLWLQRAKSNLERARLGRVSKEIMYEDLCFDAQQAAEKGLKAPLASNLCPAHSLSIANSRRATGACQA